MSNETYKALLTVWRKLPTSEMLWKMTKPQLQRELKDINNYLQKELNLYQPKHRKEE